MRTPRTVWWVILVVPKGVYLNGTLYGNRRAAEFWKPIYQKLFPKFKLEVRKVKVRLLP